MKKTSKNLSETKVELTITLDADDLNQAQQVALTKLARDLKVPGFRKGKVPIAVAAKNVAPGALMEQTLEDAVNKAVASAFMEDNIQVLDRPQVDVKKYVPGQEAEFTAVAEVMPSVKLGDYKKLGVKQDKLAVSAKDVEEVITRMREGFATREEVKRAAKLGDEVTIDYEGFKDDKPFAGGASKGYSLKLGSNSFIPGFEDGVVGHKAGDEFEIPLTFPKEYHSSELAGAKVTFKVKLHKVSELKLPEVDDEFAKKAGPFENADQLKKDIKREISAQKERETLERFKEVLIEKLVEVSTIPVPDVLLHEQVHAVQRDIQQNLQYQGRTLDDYLDEKGMTADEWHDSQELRDQANRRIKAGLALAELSKQEKITATQVELEARHRDMLAQYPDAESQKQLATPEARQEIANRLLTEKTIDRLVELNK